MVSIGSKPCSDCGVPSAVCYFPETALRYLSGGPDLDKFEFSAAVSLCRLHAFERVAPALTNNPKPWDEMGIVLPSEGEGIYVSTYL